MENNQGSLKSQKQITNNRSKGRRACHHGFPLLKYTWF
jgi:hypothetical protein